MVVTLDDTKCSAIAMELADMQALQKLVIATEQKLLPAVSGDKEISDRLIAMLLGNISWRCYCRLWHI